MSYINESTRALRLSMHVFDIAEENFYFIEPVNYFLSLNELDSCWNLRHLEQFSQQFQEQLHLNQISKKIIIEVNLELVLHVLYLLLFFCCLCFIICSQLEMEESTLIIS